jgi:hypothetical protein
MPELNEGQPERRVSALYEKMAAITERMTALEKLVATALEGKGGLLERLSHLDDCVDSVKKTVWMATGALALVSVIANILTRHA